MTEAKIKTAQITIDTESFLKLMDRALNTMEPPQWPGWALVIDEIKPTDKLVLHLYREVEDKS